MCTGDQGHASDGSVEPELVRGVSRRAFLGASAAAAAGAVGATMLPAVRAGATPARSAGTAKVLPVAAATGSSGQTQVYLLGAQGGQNRGLLAGSSSCAGTSVLIMVNGVGYLMDAGVGSLFRLNQAGFDPSVVRNIFVTHHHQDHNADLGNFLGFGWSTGRFGTSARTLDVWGPTGTKKYCAGYTKSLALSIADQEQNLGQVPNFSSFLGVHEFAMHGKILTEPVVIMNDGTVTVSAIAVNHGFPTVGYRFQTPDLDVVFSGDRGNQGDNFNLLASGAGVLFHEIVNIATILPFLEAQGASPGFISHMQNDHSAPDFVGSTATAAGVPELVLYHLIPANLAVTSAAQWTSLVSPTYAGNIVVGVDMLQVV